MLCDLCSVFIGSHTFELSVAHVMPVTYSGLQQDSLMVMGFTVEQWAVVQFYGDGAVLWLTVQFYG